MLLNLLDAVAKRRQVAGWWREEDLGGSLGKLWLVSWHSYQSKELAKKMSP